jgi:iron complex transport system ATP-binding protein
MKSRRTKTIDLRNLSIGYGSRNNVNAVASNISAGLFGGELTCLLGANGIGKSTLLRTLSAFQPKISGEIYIGDREIANYSEKELAELVSVVLTERFDVKNMTVRELIGLGRSPYTGFWGNLNSDDRAIIDRAVSLVNIQPLAKRMIHALSDGERQKVMIAKALAQQTPIILLDEPTAFLDFPSKVEIMRLLHFLSRETEKTIFLSTHDLELALQMADKIWLMDKQNGIRIGTPEDLSLDGSLSNFFARKGIMFDKDTGLFRVENEFDRQIKLSGHGQKYAMVRKALQRNGIMASRTVESETSVEIRADEMICTEPAPNRQPANTANTVKTVKTIEELLEALGL